MTPEQQAALDKIKKLLRMKRGGTADEIATALRLAQELANKHGINLDDVNPDDERNEKPLGHDDWILGSRIQWECKYAMLIAKWFFNVSPFLNNFWNALRGTYYGITFVGTEWDRQIAIYVYSFLIRHMRREWRDKRGRCRNRQAFMYGMYVGIWSKLKERQPKPIQQPGIVPVNHALARRNDYIAKLFGKLAGTDVKPDGDADKAEHLGWLAGRATEIRSGLGNTNERGQALLT